MSFDPVRRGDTVTVSFSGLLTFHDHDAGDRLVDDLAGHMADEDVHVVRFELANVEALDSHWLGVFIRVLRKARENDVRLEMVRPSADVRRLFQIVELDRVLTIVD
jgi:anti-anti-sigma factor